MKNKKKKQKERALIDLSAVEGIDFLDKKGSFSLIRLYEEQFLELNKLLKKIYKTNNLIIGNGIDELIDLLFLFFKNKLKFKKIVIIEPEYGRYRQSIIRHDLRVIEFSRVIFHENKLEQQSVDLLIAFMTRDKIDAIIFSNPGNPYPGYYTKKEIERLLNAINGSTVVIIDEAFIEYAVKSNLHTALDLIKKYKNLFVLRTFSKIYGMFGLRVGVLFNEKYIYDISQYKRKYTLSQLSILKMIKILKKKNLKKYWINTYNKNKNRLKFFVKENKNKTVVIGFTNFALLMYSEPHFFSFKVKDVTSKFNIKGKYFYRITIPDKKTFYHIKL